MKVKKACILFCSFLLLQITALSEEALYKDITSDHWAYRAIKNLTTKGILPKDSLKFNGEKKVTKYDLVYYLSKTLNEVDQKKASQSDLLILEHLIYDFSDELNKIGFNEKLSREKVKINTKKIESLEEKIKRNEEEIRKLNEELQKLK